MALSRKLAGIVVGLCLTSVMPAYADPVTYWHAIATTAVNAGRPGPPGLLDYALVQVAVHDAVQVIEGEYQPYHYSDAAGRGVGSSAAAVAAATRGVLLRLYSAPTAAHQAIRDAVNTAYTQYLIDNNLTSNAALAIGDAAAAAIYAAHYRPVLSVTPSFGNDGIGQWRSAVPMGFQFLASTTPFTLKRVDQFRPPPPPPLASMTYARDYIEVKDTVPNNPNIELARFWSGNFTLQWNEALRQVADNHLNTLGERARLLALANLAAADAAMAVWESKIFYNLWRPSTAIQLGNDPSGDDGNARTTGDPGWLPLLANPPYPDYVSGANGLTGAFTGMLREFLGTDAITFTVNNPNPLLINNVRHFTSCSQAAQEVVDARVLLGIHFRFADEEGRRLGERVAHWTFQKFLRPMPGQ